MGLIELPNKKPKNESLFRKCYKEIDDFTKNIALHKVLVDYLVLRLSMKDKKLYGVNQWKGMLNKLSSLSDDTSIRIKIVERSIEKGWATFVSLNTYNKNNFGEFNGMSCSQEESNDIDVKGVF